MNSYVREGAKQAAFFHDQQHFLISCQAKQRKRKQQFFCSNARDRVCPTTSAINKRLSDLPYLQKNELKIRGASDLGELRHHKTLCLDFKAPKGTPCHYHCMFCGFIVKSRTLENIIKRISESIKGLICFFCFNCNSSPCPLICFSRQRTVFMLWALSFSRRLLFPQKL